MLYSELLNDKIRLLKLHLEEPSMIETISLIMKRLDFHLKFFFKLIVIQSRHFLWCVNKKKWISSARF